MIAALALTAVLLTAVDPCAPVERAGGADPAAAAEYRAVGDAERARGANDTAAAAYRAAAARDPDDRHSRDALRALCTEASRGSAFDRGLARMRAGDRAGAVAAFEEARAARSDPRAALLEGICLYEMGDDDRARPLLEEAAADPDQGESARFFLGLEALRAGRSTEAAALLQQASADRQLEPFAADLARLARRDGRAVFSALLDGGFDSNVDLTPDGQSRSSGTADASSGLTVLGRVTPLGDSGPFLRGAGVWRDYASSHSLDLRGGGVAAGWQVGHGGRYLLGEWGYERRVLGGAPYLAAQRLLGAARTDVGWGATAGLTYSARWESFLPPEFESYSGLRHFAEADLSFDLGRGSSVTVAWHVGIDAAQDSSSAWREQGPRAALRLALARDVRAGLDASFSWRGYDTWDPALGARRSDQYVDAAAVLERDVSDHWTLRASLAARKTFSNVPDFVYTKIVPSLGLAYTIGLF